MAATKPFTAHLPADLSDQIALYSDRLERSRAWIVKQALINWVQDEELKYQLTMEALHEADAGKAIPHDAVVAWAESLNTDTPLPVPSCS